MRAGFALADGEAAFKGALDHGSDGLFGVEGHVRGQDHVGEAGQDGAFVLSQGLFGQILVVEVRLVFQNVQSRGTDLPGFDGADQGLGVHQFTAGGVDQDHAVLHLGKFFFTDEVVVFF